jgi:MurE/MurF fusion protein
MMQRPVAVNQTQQDSNMSQQASQKLADKWSCTSPGTVMSSSAPSLISLLHSIEYSCLCGDPASCFPSIVSVDSRECNENAFFIALCGEECDGHNYVNHVLENNCAAILVEKGRLSQETIQDCTACVIEVEDSRIAYSLLAETLFACPAHGMTMMGITGTNGKTSISYLLEWVLRDAGKRVGVIGTINYRYMRVDGELQVFPAPFTTPEPFLLQGVLREMADAGVECVIMEVSSHGLAQNRIGQLLFDVAAFTNLSRDHLDYHVNMESYFEAKALLFSKHLKENAQAVITFPEVDLSWSKALQRICADSGLQTVTCGTMGCDISPISIRGSLQHTDIVLQTDDGICEFTSPLVGDFNVQNLQTTFGMACAAGVSLTKICKSLETAVGAPGRMQRVQVMPEEEGFRPSVFVDYAHTPDALLQVLKTLKALPHNKLFCVFGCGGDRDTGKRALMGDICGKFADVAIITDDNPRSEDPASIRLMVAAGVKKTDLPERDKHWLQTVKQNETGFVLVPERSAAIAAAIEATGEGDIVLIAGKGHEDYQITANGKRFFDDTLEAKKALSSWTLKSLLLATGGRLLNHEYAAGPLGSVSTDSRTVQKNDIFVALRGEHFDAHDYAANVAKAGAACLVMHQQPKQSLSCPVLLVGNTEKALGNIAAYRRKCIKALSNPVLIGITGSSGKTTLKEMCFSIFKQQWPDSDKAAKARVLKTEGNFNNSIGLPLSLLPVTPAHRAVLLEMGMNNPGEIKRLTAIADPDIACILNVHGAHLQGLGTIEGVARAKGELFRNCRPDTVLVVNNDDIRVAALAVSCKQRKIFFGWDSSDVASLDVYASDSDLSQREEIHFTLHIGQEQGEVTLAVPGSHNISNALAAAAISHAAGIAMVHIVEGLAAFKPADSRMQIIDGPAGSRIINDCYNANPESMRAGLATLAGFDGAARVAVLGDMLELGNDAAMLHREVGNSVGELGIEFLAVLGEYKNTVQTGVQESEGKRTTVRTFTDQDSCNEWLQSLVDDGTIQMGSYILVKGSRGMHLENLVKQLQGELA